MNWFDKYNPATKKKCIICKKNKSFYGVYGSEETFCISCDKLKLAEELKKKSRENYAKRDAKAGVKENGN